MLANVHNSKITYSDDYAVIDLYSAGIPCYEHDDFLPSSDYSEYEEELDYYESMYSSSSCEEEIYDFPSERDVFYGIVKSGVPFLVEEDDGESIDICDTSDEFFKSVYDDYQYVLTKSHIRTVKLARSAILYNCRSWKYFLTFTFSPDSVDRHDYKACASLMVKWLDRLRKSVPGVMYVIVPELHKDGAIHFHGLFSAHLSRHLSDSGHFSHGHRVFNVSSYDYGFTTATVIQSYERTCTYILKYITKEMTQFCFGFRKVWRSRNLIVPKVEKYFLPASRLNIVLSVLRDSDYFGSVSRFPFPLLNRDIVHYRYVIPPYQVPTFQSIMRKCIDYENYNKEVVS